MRKDELISELKRAFELSKEKWHGVAYKQIVEQAEEEIMAFIKKEVTEEFVKRWADFWNDDFHSSISSTHTETHVRQMLEEAGVRVA